MSEVARSAEGSDPASDVASADVARTAGTEPGQLLGAIFSTSPDAVVVVDASGTVVLSNPSVTDLFGYYPEELLGASIETLLPLARREAHARHLERYLAQPHARQMGVGLDLEGRHRDGSTFPVDVSLAPVDVRGRRYVAAFVRDASEQHRAVSRLHAVNGVTQRLLGGADPAAIFPDVAATARQLSRADAVWIVLPDDAGALEIAYADGANTDLLLGVVLSAESSISAGVMRTGVAERIDDLSTTPNVPSQCAALDLGPGLYAPLAAEERRLGALVLARVHGAAAFSALDAAFAEVFASSITAAIVLGESRAELDRMGILAEDERIARDLHDSVIQQLFALGMSLQATRSGLDGSTAARVDEAVDRIDQIIRDIRNTIFRLPTPARDAEGFRVDVLATAEAARAQLGFAPRVAFDGPVDAAVSDVVADHARHVLGEALSNVARHAGASKVEVVVAVREGRLELFVVDDGKGVEDLPTAGSGLRNIVRRAEELGGTAVIRARAPRGTVLEWRVPL